MAAAGLKIIGASPQDGQKYLKDHADAAKESGLYTTTQYISQIKRKNCDNCIIAFRLLGRGALCTAMTGTSTCTQCWRESKPCSWTHNLALLGPKFTDEQSGPQYRGIADALALYESQTSRELMLPTRIQDPGLSDIGDAEYEVEASVERAEVDTEDT
ncbi:hypothetical protein LTS10_007807 [Elasticomyces elasticus]|nr:hypothetical protein LTS10_007807 [Elasticomyces elasticus]